MALPGATALHQDPGLQPERTVMSWDRSLLAMVVSAAMFLRWYGTVGVLALAPAALCAVAALVIHWTQRSRYRVQAAGIARERVHADVGAVLWLGGLVVVLALLGVVAMWSI
ncbi:DUF202 domain-containing protein [Citricoccus sp. SGAir0253]|uniref:DUF202 domain-containing protein n=1 Tax=Citricoccus sp. SGAir0253 TaxID=2567881 RepID=UPI0010CCB5F7|nr:DUF202 domain-containing protein [Citricoccus sp. SGAir0253]QCU78754.1 DUF202 domain-containing protein [Citricoccus sp. SGAir0253]